MMKIGYDAKRLFTNFTGLGNYSRSLVGQYHRAFPEDEIFLFTPDIKDEPRIKPFLDNSSFQIIQPGGFQPIWRSLDVVKDISKSGVQVYHGLSHELPIGLSRLDIKKVVTIHDLIFKYYPDDNTWFDRRIYDWKWNHACKSADTVIAISEQTKKDLVHYYNVRPEKIKVIYQSPDPVFSKPVKDEMVKSVKLKYNLPDNYNLYVGSVISRKNLLSVIRAMVIMEKSARNPLVIIGNGKGYKQKIIAEARRGQIDHLLIWLGSPSFEDFPAIYKGAQMMIYPSLYEGFGLPVIEAMHVGIPVITSDQSSLKEAGGDAAILIDPKNPRELVEAIQKITADRDLAVRMVQRGFEHVKKFSPDLLVAAIRSVYAT